MKGIRIDELDVEMTTKEFCHDHSKQCKAIMDNEADVKEIRGILGKFPDPKFIRILIPVMLTLMTTIFVALFGVNISMIQDNREEIQQNAAERRVQLLEVHKLISDVRQNQAVMTTQMKALGDDVEELKIDVKELKKIKQSANPN